MPKTTAKQRLNSERMKRRMTLADYSDYELLHVVDDHEGWTTDDLADQVIERARLSVGQRLGWLKRKGLLDRDESGGWHVSRAGRRLLSGEHIAAARELAQKVRKDGLDRAGWVINREYKRGLV